MWAVTTWRWQSDHPENSEQFSAARKSSFGYPHNCCQLLNFPAGKTVQALAILAAYRDEWPALIITPSSLRGTTPFSLFIHFISTSLFGVQIHVKACHLYSHVVLMLLCHHGQHIALSLRFSRCLGQNEAASATISSIFCFIFNFFSPLPAEAWADALHQWLDVTEDAVHIVNSARDADISK